MLELKVKIGDLESTHSEIKSKIISLQQENDNLWKEKSEFEKQVQLMQVENNK